MSFEAYKIAVKLSLVNNVSAGLLALSTQFSGLNKHIGSTSAGLSAIEARLASIKRLGLVGGAMAGVGFGALSLFKGPLEEAKKFEQEVARFGSLGFGDKINREAVKFATGMQVFGTSARDNMTMVSDAMAVFKDLHHAEFAAPLMARMKFANEAVFGAQGGEHSSKFMDMLKVIEFRGGLSSEKEFGTQANFVQQVISGSRNRVDATQLLSALKTGGVALSRRSNEQFYLGAEPLIQEFGGQRYGTGAMSVYQNLVQARGTVTAQQELFRLGLLDPKMVQFNSLGHLKKALPGAFKGSGILESEGELALLEKVLLPAFAAKGITSDEAIVRELGMIIGNRTGSGLMARIFQQRAQIKTQMAANFGAENIDQLSDRAKGTLAGKEIELHAKWRDVMRELGIVVLPIAIKAVEGLTGILKTATQFAKDFPMLTRGIILAGAALAALIGVGGTLMLATAAFKALGLALTLGGGAAGIGGLLMGVGRGVIGLAAAVMTNPLVLSLLAAGAVGYGAYKAAGALGAGSLGSWLGGKLADLTQPDPVAQMNSVRPGAHNSRGGSAGNVYLDGKKVGSVITQHQEREANRPQLGTGRFDPGMALTPVSVTGAW